ncbi:MAG: ATP-binding cassette domain-containing protein [Acidimicrobiia bacterium]|nr:ATP-binding cassette domain-containing protein [Acidimicrobiia bacterium]
MLVVTGLSKRYGTVVALDDVSFGVERGQTVGFLGPNGAGKTTTMRAIMGLVALDAGSVAWDGAPIGESVRRRVGYMPAERGMYQRMRVRDHLVYYARISGQDSTSAARAADVWLERLGLAERAGDTVQSLSSGNQQRVQLALALLNEPELLVLDEPFSGLDPVAVEVLSGILREQVAAGAALLLSSHQLDLVSDVASQVVIVDHGRVVLRGDVAELQAASTVRYVDVQFAKPTEWRPEGAATAVAGDARRHRVAVRVDADPVALLGDAQRQGDVVSWSFAPPDLSEVFLDAVGRRAVEGADGDAVVHGADGRAGR